MSEFSDAPKHYQPDSNKVKLLKIACDSIYDLISTTGITLSFKISAKGLKDAKEQDDKEKKA